MRNTVFIFVMWTLLFATNCGPSANSRYPSYEHVIAKYAPPGEYQGEQLVEPDTFPDSHYCNCPRIWYYDHWVYYYRGRWIYWDYGYWYHYPTFYISYYNGIPHVYRGRSRSITKGTSGNESTRRTRRVTQKKNRKAPDSKHRVKSSPKRSIGNSRPAPRPR
ncbi:MAG: hypothetical protein GY847_34585 [Proteobacteria bacterium]|nr:hypothetical protein [Pseudomonadota bacterium]